MFLNESWSHWPPYLISCHPSSNGSASISHDRLRSVRTSRRGFVRQLENKRPSRPSSSRLEAFAFCRLRKRRSFVTGSSVAATFFTCERFLVQQRNAASFIYCQRVLCVRSRLMEQA